MNIKEYIPTAVNIIAIVGGLSGALIWASENLASKNDVEGAKALGEFRTIELQLSFNDYRISEIESHLDGQAIDEAPLEVQRQYSQILSNSDKLNTRRDELLTSGAIK